jgi:tRNA(Phe) wybutosine-synthesizing methylase Tyw3
MKVKQPRNWIAVRAWQKNNAGPIVKNKYRTEEEDIKEQLEEQSNLIWYYKKWLETT